MTKNTRIVKLIPPTKVSGKERSKFTLTEPTAGQMRGLKLIDVLQMDVTAMIKLIPRIVSPAMTEAEVAELSPADLTQFATETVSFFASTAQLAAATDA